MSAAAALAFYLSVASRALIEGFRYKRVGSTRFVRSGGVWGSFSNVSFANAFSNSVDRINGYN